MLWPDLKSAAVVHDTRKQSPIPFGPHVSTLNAGSLSVILYVAVTI